MENAQPHYLDHRKRLKARFEKAPEAVHDAEIVELLLGYVIKGRDVKPQAKEILASAKHLDNIFESDFQSVRGVGSETVLFFNVLREFINRIEYQRVVNKPIALDTSTAVYKFLKTKIGHASHETFAIIFLDVNNHFKSCKIIRTGLINSVAIHARDIIEHSINQKTVGVIIAHNHPSGAPEPSESDFVLTRQICMALRYTGIMLVDHMIISYHQYYSMNAEGHIKRIMDEIASIT